MNNKLRKIVSSLQYKKYRSLHRLFIAEGQKTVLDLLSNKMKCPTLLATEEWLSQHSSVLPKESQAIPAPLKELQKLSLQKSAPEVIALFDIIPQKSSTQEIESSVSILLDDIQDPGNMGTIIRTCAWFGIKNIFCSLHTVDVYNPKVVQATMGAISMVNIHYTSLLKLINTHKSIPVYGAFIDGSNLYKTSITEPAFIIIGNEGKGISDKISRLVDHRISIPAGNGQCHPESLNAAVSTAIICSEYMRQCYSK